MRLNIQYLVWLANEAIKKIGLIGLLGLAILVCCCLFYGIQLLPQQNKIATLTSQLEREKLSQNTQTNHQQVVEKNNFVPSQISLADVKKFYSIFSEATNLPSMIGLIRATAQNQKLVLTRGDYKLIQTKLSQQANLQNNQLTHYEMVLPVKGSYQQIRTFIAQVLYQLPTLALSDVQLKRQNTLDPLVDARLTFVFLLRGDAEQKISLQGGQF